MKRDLDKLSKAIEEADDKGEIITFEDLLKIVTLAEVAQLCDIPVRSITKWSTVPGTLPERNVDKIAIRLGLQEYRIRKMFGVELDPNYVALENYKHKIANSPSFKLAKLFEAAEEARKAYGGKISISITTEK